MNQICTFVVVVSAKMSPISLKTFLTVFFCKHIESIARYNEIKTLALIYFESKFSTNSFNLSSRITRTIQVKLDKIIPRQNMN